MTNMENLEKVTIESTIEREIELPELPSEESKKRRCEAEHEIMNMAIAMKTLCWNFRGLGAPQSVRACRKLIKSRHPNLVFLMETKLKQEKQRN